LFFERGSTRIDTDKRGYSKTLQENAFSISTSLLYQSAQSALKISVAGNGRLASGERTLFLPKSANRLQ